jgi:hypothetical protein
VDTNILGKYAAVIFRVKVSGIRMWSGYVNRMHETCSLRSRSGGEEMTWSRPIAANKKYEKNSDSEDASIVYFH